MSQKKTCQCHDSSCGDNTVSSSTLEQIDYTTILQKLVNVDDIIETNIFHLVSLQSYLSSVSANLTVITREQISHTSTDYSQLTDKIWILEPFFKDSSFGALIASMCELAKSMRTNATRF